jgi:hypothetical protein
VDHSPSYSSEVKNDGVIAPLPSTPLWRNASIVCVNGTNYSPLMFQMFFKSGTAHSDDV